MDNTAMNGPKSESTIPRHFSTPPMPVADAPGYIEVECSYLFDWDAFDYDDLHELEEIYTRLPGYLGKGPRWFGKTSEPKPFLCASVDMVRPFRVYGVLRLEDWQQWDAAFQAAAAGLPARRIAPNPRSSAAIEALLGASFFGVPFGIGMGVFFGIDKSDFLFGLFAGLFCAVFFGLFGLLISKVQDHFEIRE